MEDGRDKSGRFTQNNPHAWRKGQSGNPKGRPLFPVSDILRELGEMQDLNLVMTYKDKEGNDKELKIDLTATNGSLNYAVGAVLFNRAIKGDMAAIKELLDRQEGKAKQSIEHTHVEPERTEQEIEDELKAMEAEEAALDARKEEIEGPQDPD